MASLPHYKFAEALLKKVLGTKVPYTINEFFGAIAFYEKYQLFFDMRAKEDNVVVWASITDSRLSEELAKNADCRWISFDDNGKLLLSGKCTNQVLLGEFNDDKLVDLAGGIKTALLHFQQRIQAFA
jgi:hypothetical protein